MAIQDFYQNLAQGYGTTADTATTNIGVLGGLGMGLGTAGLSGQSIYINSDPYTINLQMPVIPQIQQAVKKAKRFIDELRSEIQEWHGDLR